MWLHLLILDLFLSVCQALCVELGRQKNLLSRGRKEMLKNNQKADVCGAATTEGSLGDGGWVQRQCELLEKAGRGLGKTRG